MAKTWFQHDMNASAKDGLSTLLVQKNGCDLYGKFWLLQEHFYFSQMNSEKFKTTISINESTMLKVLKTNRRRLPNILETFRNILGIVSETFQKPFGIVYETTIPNALIYITKRNQKGADKIVDIEVEQDKEQEKKDSPGGGLNSEELLNEMRPIVSAINDGWKKMLPVINEKFNFDYENWDALSQAPIEELKKIHFFIKSYSVE